LRDGCGSSDFSSETAAGIDFILRNSPTSAKFLIETMPGGVALFDYNNDGLLDIFLVNGGRITEALHVLKILIARILATGIASTAEPRWQLHRCHSGRRPGQRRQW